MRTPIKYCNETILTQDKKLWIYDFKHHEWIEVTPPKKFQPVKIEPLR